MTDAPERIWAEQTGHFMKDGRYYNGGKWNDDEESRMPAYIRRDLHEAAVAAARAEGAAIRDAAENVLIAWTMGWDMDGVMDVLKSHIPPAEGQRRPDK